VVFLGIALFPDGFGPKVLGRPLHLTVKPADWWREQAATAGLAPLSSVVAKHENGQPMWLYLLARPVQPPTR
jgi:hypothetical protein